MVQLLHGGFNILEILCGRHRYKREVRRIEEIEIDDVSQFLGEGGKEIAPFECSRD